MLEQMKQLAWSDWLYHLFFSAIGGGASAVTSTIGAVIIAPETFNAGGGLHKTLELMATVFVINALLALFYYLKQSPLPGVIETTSKMTETTKTTSTSTSTNEPKP
jgi:hypothetical protein